MHAELDITAISCLCLGAFVIIFGLWSRVIKEHLYLSEPIICTIFGILLSSKALGILVFIPEDWDKSLVNTTAREDLAWLCRIIIGTQVLFAATSLPGRWLVRKQNLQSMIVLLLPVMTIAWLVSSVLVKACLPSASWGEALIIGACIAPTDPVLANSVVKGVFADRHVPLYVRQLLSAESGLNDGFGTPFLFIPILAILNHFNPIEATRDFVIKIVFYDVLFGSILGMVLGYIARKGLRVAHKERRIDRESMQVFSAALALFTIGLGQTLKTNGLLACFFAGIAVNWTDRLGTAGEALYSPFSEGVELWFDSAVFLILGTILPIDTWLDPTFLPLPNLILLAVLILIFRRLPAVIGLSKFIPVLKTTNEATFAGYFGPIGVSALYYALIATEKLPDDYAERNKIIAATTFIIFCSIIVHGASAPLFILITSIASPLATTIEQAHEHFSEGSQHNETTSLLGATRRRSSWFGNLYAWLRGATPGTTESQGGRPGTGPVRDSSNHRGPEGRTYSTIGQ